MNKCITLILALCASIVMASAQVKTDPFELGIGENLETPKIPNKAAPSIRKHMKHIGSTIAKHMDGVEMMRNDEVVEVTLPCSALFAPNSTELKESGKKYLRPFVSLLKYPTMYKVLIAVHSDDTGEAAYLDNLTESRANAIDEFLIQESNMPGENVVPYGMGPEDPIGNNRSMSGRAQNRRVELYIVPGPMLIERAKSGKLN